MRLCTFEKDGRELWGFVVRHPAYDADWVFLPEALERVFATRKLKVKEILIYSFRLEKLISIE